MVNETIQDLESYRGPDRVENVAAFHDLLRKRGWAVTPKLWSRAELTCAAIVALDPSLVYDGIVQKDGGGEVVACRMRSFLLTLFSVDSVQSRGMAFMHEKLQAIVVARLKMYGIGRAGPPNIAEALSAVVLNSNGDKCTRMFE